MVIMRRWTPTRVNNLLYSKKRIVHESRNRLGVHVFLHWYRVELNNLTTAKQPRIIGNNYMHHSNHNHDDDDDDDDNVDLVKVAVLRWRQHPTCSRVKVITPKRKTRR
mmetsp:Transcript_3544/g.3842  ORF Transcript_3544/g.3842 Transcript_3544/m.3842 type:complete len:108 (-) Transcript_3544:84-407(-)